MFASIKTLIIIASMEYKSIIEAVFPKPSKEELAAEREKKKEAAQQRKLREKKRILFQKGCAYEEAGNVDMAIKFYEKVIEGMSNFHQSYLQKSLDKLINYYRKEHKTKEEIRILQIKWDWNKDIKIRARLDFLRSERAETIYPTERVHMVLTEVPKGYKYQELRSMMDSYWSKLVSGKSSSEVKECLSNEFFDFQSGFYQIYNQAEAAEIANNYVGAAKLYETLVANRFFSCKAYDRLIVIYNKAKLYDVVENVLEEAISQAQQNVFMQNDETKLIKRWSERLTKMREKLQSKKEKKEGCLAKISPDLIELQKAYNTIESELGKIEITIKDDMVWFNGRDVCHAIGYSDPKKAMQSYCRDAIMLKHPVIGANGKCTSRIGKFIPMKDVQRMINANNTFANKERAKRLNLLQEWLIKSERECLKSHRGYVNISIDTQILTEMERQTQESQSLLSEIFEDNTNTAPSTYCVNEDTKSILSILLTQDTWSRTEVEELCKSKRLNYNVVLEQINDYAYSIVEDNVVEEDDDQIFVTTDYKKDLL